MATPAERRDALRAAGLTAQGCTRCPQLVAARSTVVFGSGDPDADLMLVGEAPGAAEDGAGVPFAGRTGELLDTLLAEIGLTRAEVFVTNTIQCRTPANRDPLPQEIANCRSWLSEKVELVRPRLICTLGSFATKVVREDPASLARVRGRVQSLEVGAWSGRLYPVLHPAAALYTPSQMAILRADFLRIPELLAEEVPAPPPPPPLSPPPAPAPLPSVVVPPEDADQLGLF